MYGLRSDDDDDDDDHDDHDHDDNDHESKRTYRNYYVTGENQIQVEFF